MATQNQGETGGEKQNKSSMTFTGSHSSFKSDSSSVSLSDTDRPNINANTKPKLRLLQSTSTKLQPNMNPTYNESGLNKLKSEIVQFSDFDSMLEAELEDQANEPDRGVMMPAELNAWISDPLDIPRKSSKHPLKAL